VGRVGITGVDTVLNHQCPARPPILPRSTYDFEPRGNTTLRANTVSAIQGVARLGEQIRVPKAVPIVPDRKRERNLPLEDRIGYHEERRAVRAHNDELGKLITQQSELFENTSWERFVSTLRGRGDLAPIGENVITHPTYGLLKHLSTKGAPAIMSTPPWELKQLDE
jgi:hypothetical protein